jgi:hypothetical protein
LPAHAEVSDIAVVVDGQVIGEAVDGGAVRLLVREGEGLPLGWLGAPEIEFCLADGAGAGDAQEVFGRGVYARGDGPVAARQDDDLGIDRIAIVW